MFELKTKRKFNELISSESYKISDFEIVEFSKNKFAIRKKNTIVYRDLITSSDLYWTVNDKFFEDCLTTKYKIIKEFYKIVPQSYLIIKTY